MFKEAKYFLMLNVFPPLIYLVISFIRWTSKVTHINLNSIKQKWETGENFIVCFWHGRLLMMPYANMMGKGKVLISRHRDGEFIARVIRYFGLQAIRGSYRKGGISSTREVINALKDGFDVAITPDGPKGPRYEVKKGIVEIARLTGKGIIPVAYGASKKKLFLPGIDSSSPFPSQRSFFSGETQFM